MATTDPAAASPATAAPAYVELHRNVVINADLWTATPQILAAGFGFEGIMGVPGLQTADDLALAIAAGAGVNLDYASLDPVPPLRNLTSAGSPLGIVGAGFGGAPTYADAMPIEVSWPLLPGTVDPTDIAITLNTGEVVTPAVAALNPNYDYNERHVIVVFGEFGNRLTPGTEGAVYPVSVAFVADDTPLMAIGPDGPVSIVGLSSASSNPYEAGPSLVGARLTRMSSVGDFAPPALDNQVPNDGVALYGEEAQYRLRLFTSGGFSPDGVSGFLPTEFARYFRLTATDAAGETVVIDQAGVDYDLGVGTVRVVGLAELGQKEDGSAVTDGPNYQEDHDNYFDIVLAGDEAAIARLTAVEIPTSAEEGYSDIYNPGGPGRTPVEGVTYTEPARPQTFPITVSLDDLGTVSYAAQTIADYDAADGLPVVFRLYNPNSGDHFYTNSSIEAAAAASSGYREEGVPFSAESGAVDLVDVYRLYQTETGDHLYTTDAAERDALLAGGLHADEGIAFQAYGAPTQGATAVQRFYAPESGDHFYTTDAAEALAAGYRYEGVAWYAASFTPAAEDTESGGQWAVLEEAFEIIDGGNLVVDPSLPLATYKSGGDNPVPEEVWRAGYDAPSPYIVNTTRNLQFNESWFLASPGEPLGTTTYITTSDGYTWAAMSEAINAMWPFEAADYAGSRPPITNAYAAGNLVVTPDEGVVKVTANFKGQRMKFYAADATTGALLERYFVTDEWGNEYIMHASGQTDQSQVRAAFEAAVLPEGWTKEVRYLSQDLILDPAEGADGTYHYLVFRDSADNTYHQIGWSGDGSLAGQIEGMPVWGGQGDDTLAGNADWDNLIHGAGGGDRLSAGGGADTLMGDAGADTLIGGAGADLLSGNQGADVLHGDAGADTLFGGQDGDRLDGGEGDDLLVGNLGGDTLTGGLGNDAFRIVAPDQGADTIADFTAGADRIEVVGPNFGAIAAGTLSAAHFALGNPADGDDWFVFDTATGTLSFDADGSGAGAAVAIATLNVRTLSANDITVLASA
ncbi:hypothetical protein [Azospirillum sp. ST 5-10]|uniref:hypothetical protein n=1 Tax=unclassified Azospirillum TaxID=2630922 RepID=UPI003F49F5F8